MQKEVYKALQVGYSIYMNNTTRNPEEQAEYAAGMVRGMIEDAKLNKDFADEQLVRLLGDFERFVEQARAALAGNHNLPAGFDLVRMGVKAEEYGAERTRNAQLAIKLEKLLEN